MSSFHLLVSDILNHLGELPSNGNIPHLLRDLGFDKYMDVFNAMDEEINGEMFSNWQRVRI